MNDKGLHIFLQSTLVSHGGGIESWLDYFLKENIDFKYYSTIFIYGFENPSNSEDLVKKYAGNYSDYLISAWDGVDKYVFILQKSR
mgnify:CR=1 FL=1